MSSCKNELSGFTKVANDIFPELKEGYIEYIIVIPNQGCGGCITSAEQFYDLYKSAHNLKFIFTNIISIKLLNNRLNINKSNTYIDSQNKILKLLPSDAKIYPSIITIENGNATKIQYQSPYEDALFFINAK